LNNSVIHFQVETAPMWTFSARSPPPVPKPTLGASAPSGEKRRPRRPLLQRNRLFEKSRIAEGNLREKTNRHEENIDKKFMMQNVGSRFWMFFLGNRRNIFVSRQLFSSIG
jgi:hypothetical protein